MDLKINNKFVAYKGCIGRRDYILNSIYLGSIVMVAMIPLNWWIMTHSQTMTEMYNFRSMLSNAPIFASFFYWFACVVSTIIGFGLLVRRLSDIWGIVGDKRIYTFATVLCVVPYLWLFCTNPLTALLLILQFVCSIAILCTPGKISGQFPHDDIKRFNWGAFWGTWIWGLFNRVYITLWALPLIFTPLGLYVSLICGMRGNEWAFKKAQTVDTQAFHKGQKNQAIVWNVLAGLGIFVLPFLLVFLITAVMVTSAIKNPESFESFMKSTESVIETVLEEQFDEYALDVDENRFYIDPRQWVNMTFDERYNLLKGASTFASMKKKNSEDKKFEGYGGSRSSEMMITKIYSSYNGELLGEFSMDMSEVKDFKSAFKSVLKSVKFNTTPELPPPLPQE